MNLKQKYVVFLKNFKKLLNRSKAKFQGNYSFSIFKNL